MSRLVCSPFAAALVLVSSALSLPAVGPEKQTLNRSFQVAPGDRLTIQNDSGRVLIRAADGPELVAAIERVSSGALPEEFRVSSGKSGKEVFFHCFFTGQSSQAVNFEIKAPKFIEVNVTGTFVDVEIQKIEGPVKVQNISGAIRLDGTTSSVNVVTTKGDIHYGVEVQPKGDVHLESTGGNIQCALPENVNLRGALRTAGSITWGRDALVRDAALEKNVGSAGPLLDLRSSRGDIRVTIGKDEGLTSAMAATAPPPVAPVPPAPAIPSPSEGPQQVAVPAKAPPKDAPVVVARPSPPRTPAPAPPPPAAPEPSLEGGAVAIKVAVDSVLLNVSVVDRASNRNITGLKKDDFVVHEDGVLQEVQELLPTEAPFSLMLLMDVSGSTEPYIRLMREAATDFVRQIKENDRIAVASFSSHVQLLQDFTNDRIAATRAISRLHPGGGTAFYDALWTCVDQYMRRIEGRKAIVVFTDGVDNQLLGNRGDGSHTTFDQLYRRIQEVDTLIYTIFLDSEEYTRTMTRGQRRLPGVYPPGGGYPPGGRYPPGGGYPRGGTSRLPWPIPMPSPSPRPVPYPVPGQGGEDPRAAYEIAREQLESIADQTGGRMYSPRRAEDLSGVYAEVAADLRIQYLLSYASSNTADGWRAIRVVVRDHPEAVVRTRKGYYARKNG